MPQPSTYPAPVLESDFELHCDFVGRRLGSTLEPAPAARLAIDFRPADNDKADRVGGGNRYRGGHDHPRGFVSGRGKRS